MAKLAMVVLFRHLHGKKTCFPGRKRLASLVGCSESSIKRALRELKGKGYIQTEPRYREEGGQTSNIYVLSRGGGSDRPGGYGPCDPPLKNKSNEEESSSKEGEDPPANGKSLFRQAQEAFISKNPKTQYQFGKEDMHLKQLIQKSEIELPDDPKAYFVTLCKTAWQMREQNQFPMFDDRTHVKRPFLPSQINSMYRFLIEVMKKDESRELVPADQFPEVQF
jgi:hypothetical protein